MRCLAKLGIHPTQTLGADGKLRFHSDNPLYLIEGDKVLAKYYYFELGDFSIGNPQVRRYWPTGLEKVRI